LAKHAEQVRRYFAALVAEHPDVPFQSAFEMRDALTHGYNKIDLGVVEVTISADLPPPGRQFEALARESQRTD
jgi:uncharacterized protein with HEPN domain